MVVAGDHANNDMAGDDDDSWKSQFAASGNFRQASTAQIAGLGEIDAIQQIYVAAYQSMRSILLGEVSQQLLLQVQVMSLADGTYCRKVRYRQRHVSCK